MAWRTVYGMASATAEMVKKLMLEKGLKQEALALMAGVSRQTVSRLVNDHGKPELESLQKIARALGVQANDLLKGEIDPGHQAFPMPRGLADLKQQAGVRVSPDEAHEAIVFFKSIYGGDPDEIDKQVWLDMLELIEKIKLEKLHKARNRR